MHIYGIKNCNSVKKALDWLQNNNIEYTFHDFKKEGVNPKKLRAWVEDAGWETLLNKRGTTWRKVAPEIQTTIVDADSACGLMVEQSSLIKRPVIESSAGLVVGFDEKKYVEQLLL